MTDQKLLVHIGYHKTATTWLQAYVLNNTTIGLAVLPNMEKIKESILLPHPLDFEPKICKMLLQYDLKSDNGETVPVITGENLSGNPHSGGYNSKEFADRLIQVCPAAKVFLVIREQRSMILSTYKQYVRAGGTLSLPAYLQSTAFDRLRTPLFEFDHFKYHRLIAYYQHLFSPANVLVLTYEQFRADPKHFVSQLMRFCDLPTDDDRLNTLPYTRRANPSLSAVVLAFKRVLNALVVEKTRLNPHVLWPIVGNVPLNRALYRLDAWLPRALTSRWDRQWRAHLEAQAKARYGHSNAVTSELIGIDLSRYGYEVAA